MAYQYVEPHTWAAETVTSSVLGVDLRDTVRWLRSRNYFDASIPSQQLLTGSSTITANRANFIRASGVAVATKLRIRVVTQAGKIHLGVYGSSGSGRSAVPSNLRASTAVIDCPTASDADIALSTQVEITSDDWLAITCSDAAAFGICGHLSGALTEAIFTGFLHYQTACFPLPATASSTGPGGDGLFAIAGIP